MPAAPLFDVVLGLAIVIVAISVLSVSDLFEAIVFFIVFGLLMSLAWTRLHAVDVALAEAAIGAGLTGALFLNALGQFDHAAARNPTRRTRAPVLAHAPTVLIAAAIAVLVGNALLAMPGDAPGLRDLVDAGIERSGARNPVTAVLLNFRAYDTLLEIAVLVLAVAGVWALGPAAAAPRVDAPPGPILLLLLRTVVPLIGVVAGYLLWVGTSGPGGAFQAGAVLCAAGILLVVTGIARGPDPGARLHRGLVVVGFAAFLAVALGVMAGGRSFLEYPPGRASYFILALEALLTISIAVILVALFSGGESQDPADAIVDEPVDRG